MKKTIVSDFMIKDPVCIDQDASLQSLNTLVNKEGFTHIPVLGEGKLVGIISKSDLMSRFLKMLDEMGTEPAEMELEQLPVKIFMTPDPVKMSEDDHIDEALEILLSSNFHCVVAVNNSDQVKGLVTSYDLLEALHQESEKIKRAS